MNIHLRRHTDKRSAPAPTTPIPTSFGNSGSQPRRTTIWRQLLSPTAAGAAAPQPTHVEATMNATNTTSRNTENRSRSQSGIRKKTACRRMRPYTQRNRTNTSNYPYIYTATPFTTRLPASQRTQPPRSISGRCKTLVKAVRRKLHLLKFSFLLRFDRFRTWFSRKLKQNFSGLGEWLDVHIPRRTPEPARRPLFQHCPNSCDAAMRAASRNGSNGIDGTRTSQGKKGGRLRRLSESTVRSLKKVCTLNSERFELREQDRRAMMRLDELWRSEEVFD